MYEFESSNQFQNYYMVNRHKNAKKTQPVSKQTSATGPSPTLTPSSRQAKGKEREIFHTNAGGTSGPIPEMAKLRELTNMSHIIDDISPPPIPPQADTLCLT